MTSIVYIFSSYRQNQTRTRESTHTQRAFNCSMLTTETIKQGVKYVQS